MSENRFQNKYRIPSSRAEWHSYEGGGFFVTVCTQYRQKYFGEIECGEMRLSELGKYLAEQIVITPQMRSDMNVEIPSFVIMPNHVHMIIRKTMERALPLTCVHSKYLLQKRLEKAFGRNHFTIM